MLYYASRVDYTQFQKSEFYYNNITFIILRKNRDDRTRRNTTARR